MSGAIEGGCHCGALRYRVDEPLQHASYCHCRICQRTMGSPAGIFAGVSKPEAFHYTAGEPRIFASSEKAQREFCGTCGCHLVFRRRDGSRLSINVVTLDDPSIIEPTLHIWTESSLSWFDTRDDHPRRLQSTA
ncbi:MAG: GFA family protein [Alphaproteobacteria bacterium]|nr:GFA family protein [Alphaproteobacteria bacterium]